MHSSLAENLLAAGVVLANGRRASIWTGDVDERAASAGLFGRGLQGFELRLAGQATLPDEDPVLVEGHLRVQRRAVGAHQLRHGREGKIAPRVVEEGHRQPVLRRAHCHPVLHALVHRVAQNLRDYGTRSL